MDSLSIVQQRIIVTVLSVFIIGAVWWQNSESNFDPRVEIFSTTFLPDVVAQLDFTSAEASWSRLRVDPQGNLRVDALTHTALADAIALMHGEAPALKAERLTLLLEKQFGTSTSQQIMELIPTLKSYAEIEQRWWEENGSRNPPKYEQLFHLQDELLGEDLARKMFSEQRRLAKMMLASQQIHNDATLTQAQRDQALIDLQKTFEQGSLERDAHND